MNWREFIMSIILFVGLVLSAILILLSIGEIIGIANDNATYKHLYSIGPDALHIQFKSITHLIAWNLIAVILSTASIVLIVSGKIKYPTIRYSIVFYYALLIVWLVRYYVLLRQSGYDHYPGFDPYLL